MTTTEIKQAIATTAPNIDALHVLTALRDRIQNSFRGKAFGQAVVDGDDVDAINAVLAVLGTSVEL